MGRVSGVAGVALFGIGLAGCGMSSWIPSWDLKFPSTPPPASTVQVESEPAGAEAKSSTGPSCRTPCSLTVATADPFTVTFTLTGYESQTVPVAPRPRGGDVRDSSEALKFDPDPVYAQLEPTAPAKGKKRPPAKKTSAAPPVPAAPK